MTIFNCWVRGCEMNKSTLYCLERSDKPSSGVFKVTSQTQVGNSYQNRNPVYMVWWNGKNIYSGMNYREAICVWEGINKGK